MTDERVAFVENQVQTRGGAIIAECGKSSNASAANAACDHMMSWWYPNGRAYSMGVIIDEGVKVQAALEADCTGLCFGIACKTSPEGKWQ
jgi:malate/lactate dehydrogenase